ncbi:precorrin-2 dehydrogenase-like protein DsrV [Candidatus Sulfotelmatobacter sp. SbA7]|nr:precorrin-2 dehydrogenase-like protein DsrV [Candidatus Sulfotelmatobacter sp. SbA7]
MKRADVSLFPILLKLKAKKCVVVGAGKIAAAKAAGLLASGAQVIVISPRADAWIRSQARAGKLIWHRRRFVAADMEHAFLVVAATNSNATNEAVFQACAKRAVLCNVADDPERCDFFYPAVVRRGPLQIAISTSGRSPALARRLRIELERQFGPEYSAWVEQVGEMREKLRGRDLSAAERRRLLEEIAGQSAFERFVQHRETKARYPKERSRR